MKIEFSGCIDCPYRGGYYNSECRKSNKIIMSYYIKECGYPSWCPMQDTEKQEVKIMTIRFEDCREEVKQFAISMEKALLENDKKGGWQNDGASYFADKIYQHTKEMNLAVNQQKYKTALNHAIHITNYCMMFHDNYFEWRL